MPKHPDQSFAPEVTEYVILTDGDMVPWFRARIGIPSGPVLQTWRTDGTITYSAMAVQ